MEDKSPWSGYDRLPPEARQKISYPTGKREVVFCVVTLLFSLALCNFTLFGGFNLGFAAAVICCEGCAFLYLLLAGCKPDGYSGSLLLVGAIIAAGFARSDDDFVKFVMVCFLAVSVNLGLCLMAGQNRYCPGTVRSLLDAPRAALQLGIGRLPEAFRGLRSAFARSGAVGQKGGAFLLGLCLCVPVLAIVIPLLISADAAFDGLVSLLPEFELDEFFATAVFGCGAACVLYTRGVALRHSEKQPPAVRRRKGMNAITVNTVLGAVCVVYLVYLFSQLAYFAGGFAGILPEGYTTAQYARRGFFEMACLCAVNLTVMVLALGMVRREQTAPVATRILCLFLGVVTLFLVAAASAKMFLYIGTYGLSRLRVLTQIIMLFIALTTLILSVWLFVPKLAYMKAVLLTAMVIGAATIWTDVDTLVARYNVDAYLSGSLQSVDVGYLYGLGDSSVPYLSRLAELSQDPDVAAEARRRMKGIGQETDRDLRSWNYVNHKAGQYVQTETAE